MGVTMFLTRFANEKHWYKTLVDNDLEGLFIYLFIYLFY